MGSITVIVLFIVYAVGVRGQGPPDSGGPPEEEKFVMKFLSSVYVCPDDISKKFVDTSELETKHYNESAVVMTGTIYFYDDFEDLMMEAVVEKESNGRLEMMLTHEICHLCAEIGNKDSDYHGYIKYCGLPDECPVTPGPVKIHDLLADTDDLPINSANMGYYQITTKFYKNPSRDCKGEKNFVGCMKLDVVIEPE